MFNKRVNVIIKYRGLSLCVAEWAKKLGVRKGLLHARKTKLKWCDKKIIETPILNSSTRIKGAYFK